MISKAIAIPIGNDGKNTFLLVESVAPKTVKTKIEVSHASMIIPTQGSISGWTVVAERLSRCDEGVTLKKKDKCAATQ